MGSLAEDLMKELECETVFTLPIGTPVYREQLDALSLELGNNSYDSGLPLEKNS